MSKIFSVIVLIALFSGMFFTFPDDISAQTNSANPTNTKTLTEQLQELRELVSALKSQIEELHVKLETTQKELAVVKSEIQFTKFLSKGVSGNEVTQLQEMLKQDPEIYPEGLVTGFFGPATESAVRKFQEKHGIESLGIIGPKTRSKLNELITKGAVEKVVICHIPPGEPTNKQTIEIDQSALDTHLAHGDSKGACVSPLPPPPPSTATTTATTTPPTPPPSTATTTATSTPPMSPPPPSTSTATTTERTPSPPPSVATTTATSTFLTPPPPPSTTSTSDYAAVRITTPNGNEIWYKGGTYTIAWDNPLQNGFSGQENYQWLVLLTTGNTAYQADDRLPVTQSSYQWNKWSFGAAGDLPFGSDYKAQVILSRDCVSAGRIPCTQTITPPPIASNGKEDVSDNTFTVALAPPPPPPPPPSPPSSTTTPPPPPPNVSDTTPPSVPTALRVRKLFSNNVTFDWQSSVDNVGIAGYNFYRNGNFLKNIISTAPAEKSVGQLAGFDNTISPDMTYTLTVAAYDAAANISGQSNPITFTSPHGLSAPTNIQATNITATSTLITWTTNVPANSRVVYSTSDSYYIGNGITNYNTGTLTDTVLATSHSVLVLQLQPGTVYHYAVVSEDAAGNFAESGDYTFTTNSAPTSMLAPSERNLASVLGSLSQILETLEKLLK